MTTKLQDKLKTLPLSPGVYFHKNAKGQIIYVGKAAVLKNRVRQYFQKTRDMDTKTQVLVAEIADTDWITTESEIDALFLESEMVKRYKPRYNILLQDDRSQLFVRITMHQAYPYISYTRQPLDDGAEYFGPYYNGWAVKKALRYLRKIFPYSTHTVMPKRVCLQYHIGLCPGVEEQKVSSTDYKKSLRKLMLYLTGDRKRLVQQLEAEMKLAAKHHHYETAAKRRNQIHDLRELQKQIVFSDREFMDISKDQALAGLADLLGLKGIPRRIEGYDISHMQGTNNVASMVVASNGLADKAEYRKFKMRLPGNNDFGHMHEVISRRFSGKHLDWSKPDLLLIDGGKGQLGAALAALEEKGVAIPAIGLAKRLEEIVVHKTRSGVSVSSTASLGHLSASANPASLPRHSSEGSVLASFPRKRESSHNELHNSLDSPLQGNDEGSEVGELTDIQDGHEHWSSRIRITSTQDFYIILLPKDSHIVKLLQRIRDESHRFAVSYHTVLKRQRQTASELDTIPGIGPVTRKKLVQSFGSLRAVKQATRAQIVAVVGEARAKKIWPFIQK